MVWCNLNKKIIWTITLDFGIDARVTLVFTLKLKLIYLAQDMVILDNADINNPKL
jgi:hypothetical protein